MRAIKGAAALRDYKPATSRRAPQYIDALEGKTDLDRTWLTTIVEASCQAQRVAGGVPEPGTARRDRKSDGAERKRLHVLNFGWNNCAVNLMRMNTLRKSATSCATT